MPDVTTNREVWDASYDWAAAGDEWSTAWGSTESEWHATLLPRLRSFTPSPRVLEIACGFGRWSQYLIPRSEQYVGIDLAAAAVEGCRERFAGVANARFEVTDGRSLDMVDDGSIDLAFSFDSLVHVESDVIEAYLSELKKKLAPQGVAFLHHSNLGNVKPIGQPWRVATRAHERLAGRSTVGLDHWRGPSVSADQFATAAKAAGLVCFGQEVLNWGGARLIDCISLVTQPGSRWDRPLVRVTNPYFMAEAASAARTASLYDSSDSPEPAASRDSASIHYFGPSSMGISSTTVGPWSMSVLGPLPRLRQLVRRGRGSTR
jgi:SAM-dependent methyltransferase